MGSDPQQVSSLMLVFLIQKLQCLEQYYGAKLRTEDWKLKNEFSMETSPSASSKLFQIAHKMSLGTLLLGTPRNQAERQLVRRGLILASSVGKVAMGHPSTKVGCEMHQDYSNGTTHRTFSNNPRASFSGSGHRESHELGTHGFIYVVRNSLCLCYIFWLHFS